MMEKPRKSPAGSPCYISYFSSVSATLMVSAFCVLNLPLSAQVVGRYIPVQNPLSDMPLELRLLVAGFEDGRAILTGALKGEGDDERGRWWGVSMEALSTLREPAGGAMLRWPLADEHQNVTTMFVDPSSGDFHTALVRDGDGVCSYGRPRGGSSRPNLLPCVPRNAIPFRLEEGSLASVLLPPASRGMLGPVLFRPSIPGNYSLSLFVWNNLTGLEALPLSAQGGRGNLRIETAGGSFLGGTGPVLPPPDTRRGTAGVSQVRGREADSLRFQISADELPFQDPGGLRAHLLRPYTLPIRVRNDGDLPLKVLGLDIGGVRCGGSRGAFSVDDCRAEPFWIEPLGSRDLTIRYTSSCAATRELQSLVIETSVGPAIATIIADVAPAHLRECDRIRAALLEHSYVLLFIRACVFGAAMLFAVWGIRNALVRALRIRTLPQSATAPRPATPDEMCKPAADPSSLPAGASRSDKPGIPPKELERLWPAAAGDGDSVRTSTSASTISSDGSGDLFLLGGSSGGSLSCPSPAGAPAGVPEPSPLPAEPLPLSATAGGKRVEEGKGGKLGGEAGPGKDESRARRDANGKRARRVKAGAGTTTAEAVEDRVTSPSPTPPLLLQAREAPATPPPVPILASPADRKDDDVKALLGAGKARTGNGKRVKALLEEGAPAFVSPSARRSTPAPAWPRPEVTPAKVLEVAMRPSPHKPVRAPWTEPVSTPVGKATYAHVVEGRSSASPSASRGPVEDPASASSSPGLTAAQPHSSQPIPPTSLSGFQGSISAGALLTPKAMGSSPWSTPADRAWRDDGEDTLLSGGETAYSAHLNDASHETAAAMVAAVVDDEEDPRGCPVTPATPFRTGVATASPPVWPSTAGLGMASSGGAAVAASPVVSFPSLFSSSPFASPSLFSSTSLFSPADAPAFAPYSSPLPPPRPVNSGPPGLTRQGADEETTSGSGNEDMPASQEFFGSGGFFGDCR
jgi:hypothetical protein